MLLCKNHKCIHGIDTYKPWIKRKKYMYWFTLKIELRQNWKKIQNTFISSPSLHANNSHRHAIFSLQSSSPASDWIQISLSVCWLHSASATKKYKAWLVGFYSHTVMSVTPNNKEKAKILLFSLFKWSLTSGVDPLIRRPPTHNPPLHNFFSKDRYTIELFALLLFHFY